MKLAKSGEIQHVCQPNALMTLKEYTLDFGDDELKEMADHFIAQEVEKIKKAETKQVVIQGLKDLSEGKRDIFL